MSYEFKERYAMKCVTKVGAVNGLKSFKLVKGAEFGILGIFEWGWRRGKAGGAGEATDYTNFQFNV